MLKKKLLFIFILILLVYNVNAGNLMSFQGRVGSGGNSISTGNITLYIFDSSSGGSQVHFENFTNNITNGYFDLVIGSSANLNLVFGQNYWLDMRVNGEDINWSGSDRIEFTSSVGNISSSVNNNSGWTRTSGNVSLTNKGDFVGIGTDSPDEQLHINGTNAAIKIEDDLSPTLYFYDDSVLEGFLQTSGVFMYMRSILDDLYLGSAASALTLTIDAGGNVGIDNVDPYEKLHVNGSLRVDDANSDVIFFVNSSQGRVGIGTSSPNTTLHVNSTNDTAILIKSSNGGASIKIDSNHPTGSGTDYVIFQRNGTQRGLIAYNHEVSATSDVMRFIVGGTSSPNAEKMRIKESGYLGLGTKNPTSSIHVNMSSPVLILQDSDNFMNESGYAGFVRFYDQSGNQSGYVGDGGNGKTMSLVGEDNIDIGLSAGKLRRMTINATTGNIGVGTTQPQSQLTIFGDGEIRLEDQNSNYNFTINPRAAGHLGIGDGVTDFLSIQNNTGFVGIDTVYPHNLFEVKGAGNGTISMGQLPLVTNFFGIIFDNISLSTYNYHIASDGTHLLFNRPSGYSIVFREVGVDQMIITTGGNMGIGTVSPTNKLQINGSLMVEDSNNSLFFVDSQSKNVGIGATTPIRKLHINGTGNVFTRIQTNMTSFASQLEFKRFNDSYISWIGPSASNSFDMWSKEDISFKLGLNDTQVLTVSNTGTINISGAIINNNISGMTSNLSVGNCWMAYQNGLMYSTNCTTI